MARFVQIEFVLAYTNVRSDSLLRLFLNNLYIMWLFALRFVTCKFSVHAFSLIISNFLITESICNYC